MIKMALIWTGTPCKVSLMSSPPLTSLTASASRVYLQRKTGLSWLSICFQ